MKGRLNRAQPSNLFLWRDRTGNEVDVLIEDGSKLHPLEIKSGGTVNADFFGGLQTWMEMAGKAAGTARLVYGGDTSQTRQGVAVSAWRELAKLVTEL